MFHPGLNVTVVESRVPRETTVAIWRTPEQLGGHMPATRGPASSDPVFDGSIELCTPGGAGPLRVAARMVRLRDIIDELGRTPPPGASRSVRALAHVTQCSLRLIAAGRLQPGSTHDATDIWIPGPLEADDVQLLHSLAGWVPPEFFCVHPTGDQPGQDTARRAATAESAVRAVFDSVTDAMPRSPAAGLVSGLDVWTGMEAHDVGALGGDLRASLVHQRSVLQLRLTIRDDETGRGDLFVFLRSRADGFRPTAAADLWAGVETFPGHGEEDLLFLLRRAAQVWEPLGGLLDQPAPARLAIDPADVVELLSSAAHELTATGVEVMVPTDLLRPSAALPRARTTSATADTTAPRPAGSGLFTISSLCEVSWSVSVGGRELTGEELERVIDAKRRLIRLDDGWVLLDDRTLARLRDRRTLGAASALGQVLGAGGSHPDAGAASMVGPPGDTGRDDRAWLNELVVDEQIGLFLSSVVGAMTDQHFEPPAALVGELRPYQRAGVAWMTTLAASGFGGILADDMGLGKTIQVIAAHLWLAEHRDELLTGAGNTLMVVPAGLLHNWSVELARWAPGTRVHHYHGADRSLDGLGSSDVVLTTYGIVRRDGTLLAGQPWMMVVADEAQAMKNRTSATARAMRGIPATVRFALTGTPVENHLGELWSILNWTTPGLLGSPRHFSETIVEPMDGDSSGSVRARLGRILAPFMLRRTKSDPLILPDLPPRTITDHPVDPTEEQALLYKAETTRLLGSIATASGMGRRGAVFKLLTALKQICNHPAHFLGPGVADASTLSGRSGKFDLMCDLVGEITASSQSVVIFTQYVRMGELIVEGLGALGQYAEMLHGGMTLQRRNALVERFQGHDLDVMVVSLRAGGTGLNLTAATHVIHYDRWWNPAVENQASDRVWRIGQDRPVQIHRLVTSGTVEERIATLLDSKQHVADVVLDDITWISELGDDELVQLVRLDEKRSDE